VVPTVLLVSNDQNACTLLTTVLEAEGMMVAGPVAGDSALETAIVSGPSLILMNVNPARVKSFQLLQHLRGQKNTASTPIIVFGESACETDLALALEMGADDYFLRPLRPTEVIARVRAVLRRSGGAEQTIAERRVGPLAIDAHAHTVTYQDEPVAVTRTELYILNLLAAHAGTVVTREQIIHVCRKSEHPVLPRSVDVHIRSIRRKLRGGAHLVMTIRAVGYRLKGAREIHLE